MNKLKVFFLGIVFCSVLLQSCQSTTENTEYDTVIKNGNIYTMESSMPQAEAVGVKDGKIAFVGSAAEAESGVTENTKVVDLEGKTMTPGFIESHAHIMGIGYNRINLDLLTTKSSLPKKIQSIFLEMRLGGYLKIFSILRTR